MLTSQQLAETIEYLRAHGIEGGSEKRRATRMQVQSRIKVGRLANGRVVQSFTLLTKDVSSLGMGLIQGIRVQPNQELVVELPRIKGPPLYMKCIIKHCRDLADNLFSVGAEFVESVSADLAQSLEHANQAEQQRLQRSILD